MHFQHQRLFGNPQLRGFFTEINRLMDATTRVVSELYLDYRGSKLTPHTEVYVRMEASTWVDTGALLVSRKVPTVGFGGDFQFKRFREMIPRKIRYFRIVNSQKKLEEETCIDGSSGVDCRIDYTFVEEREGISGFEFRIASEIIPYLRSNPPRLMSRRVHDKKGGRVTIDVLTR